MSGRSGISAEGVHMQALECMETWPLMNKNKVEDSQVYLPVEEFAQLEDERVKTAAQKVCPYLSLYDDFLL